jgi:hypothetical protein
MLLTLCAASGQAAEIDQVVGAVAPDGGAQLVKHFQLGAGSVIVGVEFVSNDLRTVFPRVALLQGGAERMSEAIVLREVHDVQPVVKHRIHIALPPITVTESQEVYVAITLPASNGVRAVKDGAGLGATRLGEPNGSYLASPPDGTLYPIDVDLAIDVIVQTVGKTAPSAEDGVARPQAFLRAANPSLTTSPVRIEFGVVRASRVNLSIYDVAGRRVRALVDGVNGPGTHTEQWDGRDEHGRHVADGVYVVKLRAGETSFTQKLVLLR